ncbi:MAG: hypothetical protein ACFFEV_08220 [Candidatus Thorarchaeota archaeon]
MRTFEEERESGLDGPDWNTAHGLWVRFLVAVATTFAGTILWLRMDLYGITMVQFWGMVAFIGVGLIAWFGFTRQAIFDIRFIEALNSINEDILSGENRPW